MPQRSLKDSQDRSIRIPTMSRSQLIETLKDMNCSFAMDFDDGFLDTASVERLRHIVLAASLHEQGEKNAPCPGRSTKRRSR